MEKDYERKTFAPKTIESFESVDNVVRILSLIQIERELKEYNDQFSSELEAPIAKIYEKNAKVLSLAQKKRLLGHLSYLIEDEERKIEDFSQTVQNYRKEMKEISESCLSVIKSVLKWLKDQHASARGDFIKAMDECRNIQLKVEILRFKMVEKLEKLYPIQCDSANAKISIRGVSLKNVEDEESVSTALGYIAHALVLIAKYLQIPLRYKPHYQSSRSYISDDASQNTERCPLFLKAGVKEKLGLGKIEQNLKQILRNRGLQSTKESKMTKTTKDDSEHIPSYTEILSVLQTFFERELHTTEVLE